VTGSWLLLLVVILLLTLSAFFVAAEFSLISARRTVIEPRAVTSARARTTLRAMEDVTTMMACAQLGITVCGVLLGAVGEPAVATLLEPVFHHLGVPEGALHPVSLVVALLLVVGAHVALGEMVPKNVALAGPENTAILLAPPLRALALFLNAMSNAVVRLLGKEPRDEVASAFTRDEVAGMVSESRSEGLLDRGEHDLITSALDFDTATVDSVLLPDADVVSLHEGVTAAEVEQACARTGFSRFPVRDARGAYVGYLHIRDVLDIPSEQRDHPVALARIQPLPVVLAGSQLRTALDRMRRRGAHLAQVTAADRPAADLDVADAAGQLYALVVGAVPAVQPSPAARLGLVTLEDVIEELIGEVRDATRRQPSKAAAGTGPATQPGKGSRRALRRRA
jgi:CBS domain containing-hemolysin-like protein